MADQRAIIVIGGAVVVMLIFFWLGTPVLMDDGAQYQGFTEALARGVLDFKSFYGFQGLSFFAVPVYWVTHSPIAIIITSMIFSLLSIPLAYAIGQRFGSGLFGVMVFLLTPYPYLTLMRGFQEAALLFFILFIVYGSLTRATWSGLVWGMGTIVKPFAFVLAPLFLRRGMRKFEIWYLVLGISILGLYGVANYMQTGHFVTLAATGAYEGAFDPGNIPALGDSFTLHGKTWLRAAANILVHTRKIMVSPLLVILGLVSLWRIKTLPLRNPIFVAIALNLLLVGPLTYAFPKYLLPMTTLVSFAAVPLLVRFPLVWPIVFIDSIFVFIPNYRHFGHVFWDSPLIASMPLMLAVLLWLYETFSHSPDPARAG